MKTWIWRHVSTEVICFEDSTVLGFAHIFASCDNLLENWQRVQQLTLSAHGLSLRSAASKAWNVYSIFLAPDDPGVNNPKLEALEEDFTFTRKIARGSVQTISDVELALLPILPLRNLPSAKSADYLQRVKANLRDLPQVGVSAFLSDVEAEDIVAIFSETK